MDTSYWTYSMTRAKSLSLWLWNAYYDFNYREDLDEPCTEISVKLNPNVYWIYTPTDTKQVQTAYKTATERQIDKETKIEHKGQRDKHSTQGTKRQT